MRRLLLFVFVTEVIEAQSPNYSSECQAANIACEEDTDCVHRLAVLQSTCVTNTCQPQCRNAVLNLYQNRLGRALLRTDVSCIPGRYELELCNLIPNKSPIYCNLAKLACEADLMCSSRYGVFASECEAEAAHGDCSARCRSLINDTLKTSQGAAFASCTCTDTEDKLCLHFKDVILRSCIPGSESTVHPVDNSVMQQDETTPSNSMLHVDADGAGAGDGTLALQSQFTPFALLCILLLFRWSILLF